MMKYIFSKLGLIRSDEKHLFPNSIYVKKSEPLPVVGESVVVTSLLNGKQFAGVVTSVDEKKRLYGAQIDLSNEILSVGAPSIHSSPIELAQVNYRGTATQNQGGL